MGEIRISSKALKVIDHPFFQSLRHVKQLGAVSLVYPSATHTRFEHCLETMHVAQQLIDQLLKNECYELKDPVWQERVCIAALIHDLGHSVLSHTFDDFIESLDDMDKPCNAMRHHESRSIELFKAQCEELGSGVFTAEDIFYISHIAQGLVPEAGERISAFIFEIVANRHMKLDVDKLAYLKLDSKRIGLGDCLQVPRLLRHARIQEVDSQGNRLEPGDRHLMYTVASEVEEVFAFRAKMHSLVYQHKTVCKFKAMYVEILRHLYLAWDWKSLMNNYETNGHLWRLLLTDDIFHVLKYKYTTSIPNSPEQLLLQPAHEILMRIDRREKNPVFQPLAGLHLL